MFFFFFSSRRRHTRSKRDWSSDVCSSDLPRNPKSIWRERFAMSKRACLVLFMKAGLLFGAASFVRAQQPQTNPEVYSQLQFRYIGPVGNRTTAVTGVPGQPYLYYVGAASGGIFKTTDGGI